MIWVWVVVGIALFAAVLTIGYAVWLWQKLGDLWSEIEMLMQRANEMGELAAQLDIPDFDHSAVRRAAASMRVPLTRGATPAPTTEIRL
ncbi:hypothetical protein [Granulicoccus phenolivorans]|uniref:hypothetical protein n=1 Tax=Granulicoccus phenolivorans TaxID=266854 RepID=UPI000415BAF8|nr:hypothetical protein [Granulicoccus phenolivorans]